MNIPPKYLAAASVLLAAFLTLIVWLVSTRRADGFDFPIRETVLAYVSPTEVVIWNKVTLLGSTITITCLTVLCIIFFSLRCEWETALHMELVMTGASIIDAGLKWAVHRPRPSEFFPHTMPTSFSFPSGHALFAFALYISLEMIHGPHISRRSRKIVVALASCIVIATGASRILLGVHFPSDVLGGYLAAALWLMLCQWVRLITRRDNSETSVDIWHGRLVVYHSPGFSTVRGATEVGPKPIRLSGATMADHVGNTQETRLEETPSTLYSSLKMKISAFILSIQPACKFDRY